MGDDYTLGPVPAQQTPWARFETKPSPVYSDGTRDSGGGYERWRSYEHRPETRGTNKEDVYVAHHRLLAVVACYPADMPVGEILADLHGKDIHHTAPEADGDRGVEWDNRPACLQVISHGRHAEITQAERLAWAQDAKEDVEEATRTVEDRCSRCGSEAETLATSEDFDGNLCLPCAKDASDGAPIEV